MAADANRQDRRRSCCPRLIANRVRDLSSERCSNRVKEVRVVPRVRLRAVPVSSRRVAASKRFVSWIPTIVPNRSWRRTISDIARCCRSSAQAVHAGSERHGRSNRGCRRLPPGASGAQIEDSWPRRCENDAYWIAHLQDARGHDTGNSIRRVDQETAGELTHRTRRRGPANYFVRVEGVV